MLEIIGIMSIAIAAYLLGSVSSAIIVCKMFSLPDPRTTGSKNPGATNVLRLGGKKKAAIVLVSDFLKGFIPTLIASLLFHLPIITAIIALFAVLGHIFPVFYGFKGGKGVATALGCYFGLGFIFGIMAVFIWWMACKLSHYSSLSSIITVIFVPILVIGLLGLKPSLPFWIMMAVILYKHKSNIERLRAHTEPRVSFFEK